MDTVLWDGVGFPPQGSTCGYNVHSSYAGGFKAWVHARVKYLSSHWVVIEVVRVPFGSSVQADMKAGVELMAPADKITLSRFSVIQAADLEQEEAKNHQIAGMIDVMSANWRENQGYTALKLFEAGYRQAPGYAELLDFALLCSKAALSPDLSTGVLKALTAAKVAHHE
jgi:hypothetical protein